jgi:hypothetical protein
MCNVTGHFMACPRDEILDLGRWTDHGTRGHVWRETRENAEYLGAEYSQG